MVTTGSPSIIFVMVDQVRGDCLGAGGNSHIDALSLDYLSSRGAQCRRAYSAVPSCIPARACLWKGQSQWHAGVLGVGWGQVSMPNDYPHMLAGELTNAGYTTDMVGKGHSCDDGFSAS